VAKTVRLRLSVGFSTQPEQTPFTPTEITALSRDIDPETDSDLDYYPLQAPGERFPVADPGLAPRLTPVPPRRADFLKAMLEGIADIEARGYTRLAELGGPALTSVRSVGAGAQNQVWSRMRAQRLGVEMISPLSVEAAYGVARLARFGIARRLEGHYPICHIPDGSMAVS